MHDPVIDRGTIDGGCKAWLVANTLWPLNRGGLRPNALWTAGLEYNF